MAETTDLTENGSVLYSQKVTEEIVAQMETDLGAASFSGFTAVGPPYGVDALNQITADLVTKGILNIGNRCKVSISGSTISVQSGVCVFGDGSKVRIETSATVNFISGYTNYVYFIKTTDNRILLYNSKTKITDEVSSNYCVKLAEISSDKVVNDKRRFAISKTFMGINKIETINQDFEFPKDGNTPCVYEISLPHEETDSEETRPETFRYVVMKWKCSGASKDYSYLAELPNSGITNSFRLLIHDGSNQNYYGNFKITRTDVGVKIETICDSYYHYGTYTFSLTFF